jgi:hypothetical protein
VTGGIRQNYRLGKPLSVEHLGWKRTWVMLWEMALASKAELQGDARNLKGLR